MRISVTNSSAAGGSSGGWLRFENTGTAPCAIAGFPLLVGISPDGQREQARHADELLDAPRVSGTPATTLQPGESAFAAFTGQDAPGDSRPCPPPYVALEVAAPGSAVSTRLSSFIAWLGGNLPSCAGIEVMPVIGGGDLPASLASLRP